MFSTSLLSAMSDHSKAPVSKKEWTSERTGEDDNDESAGWDPKPEKMYVLHEALSGGSSPASIALAIADSRGELQSTLRSGFVKSPGADHTQPISTSASSGMEVALCALPDGCMQPPAKKRRTMANCPDHMPK